MKLYATLLLTATASFLSCTSAFVPSSSSSSSFVGGNNNGLLQLQRPSNLKAEAGEESSFVPLEEPVAVVADTSSPDIPLNAAEKLGRGSAKVRFQ